MQTHFRKSRWGMTRAQVIRLEGRQPAFEQDDTIMYDDVMIGSPCYVNYTFDKSGRLRSGGYSFDHQNDLVDVNDFFELSKMLDEKYGEPIDVGATWRDPYRARAFETTADVAKVVGTGEASLRRVWRTDDTLVRLILTEDTQRYNAILWLFYNDVAAFEADRDQRFGRDIALL